MLVRNCAGGVVFYEDKVFLIKNEKNEWGFPKGVVRNGSLPSETALKRVCLETGINAKIISTAGGTSYEFFSFTRQRPVCNKITWYIMSSANDKFSINEKNKIHEGGYFDITDAMKMVTYSQDKSLLNLCYKKLKELAAG